METTVLQVNGMSCQHCVQSIEQALTKQSGVASVVVDLAGKTVTVQHNGQLSVQQLADEIEAQGFDVV